MPDQTEQLDRLKAALGDRYKIESLLGQGGMATVYLAEDVRHRRKVALKVLRPELAAVIGAARFLNEITVTANLQHPNILALYDSGEADTFLYYVMPYVEGDTLRDKLDREKQLGIDEAVEITKSIASALDYAHRQNVIHRDIKPENILIHDSQALVADFGIALAVSEAGGSRLTETGLSLGTPHYMSPEQAMGDREIDARSDVYSLGAILYEMLTGEPPYTGSTAQAIVARVITEDPRPLTLQRRTVPNHVAATVHKALSKLPADRFPSAAQFADALANPAYAVPTTAAVRSTGTVRPSLRRFAWPAVAVAAAAVAAFGWLRPGDQSSIMRLRLAFPEEQAVVPASTLRLAISPDGRRIAYTGPDESGQSLWVRDLDELDARPLPGTEEARAPFFSPDGESIAFFTGEPGDLKVVRIDGGPPRVLVADSVSPFGGHWFDDDIYFVGAGGGVWRIPVLGGAVALLSTPDTAKNESEHDYPHVLPGGTHALVTIWRGSVGTADVGVLSFESGETTILTQGAYARYLSPGWMLYATAAGKVLLAPFDPDARTMGPGVAVLDGVRLESFSAAPQLAISNTGTLLYQTGGGSGDEQLVWASGGAEVQPVDSTWLADFGSLAISPDGSQLAVSLIVEGKEGVWIKQLDAGPLSRLTFEGDQNYRPAWHPDGRSVAFISDRSGRNAVWMQRADGSAAAEVLVDDNRSIDEVVWSADGQWVVYRTGSGGLRTRDLWAVRPGIDSVPRPIAVSPFDEFAPALSPDGRWVAYVSQESGRSEVWVRPFPDAERARWQVSLNGGSEPQWDPRGGRLFYRTRSGDMMAAPLAPGDAFQVGTQEILFREPSYRTSEYHQGYVVHPDGRRLILIRPIEGGRTDIVLVVDWLEAVSERLQR